MTPAALKAFSAVGYDRGSCRCGGCPPDLDEHAVVVANTRCEALGFLLEQWPSSKAHDWEIEEIDTTRAGVKK